MSDNFHSAPLNIRGFLVAQTPDTVTQFVLGNVALVATISIEEKIQMLRTISQNKRPEARGTDCARASRAAVLLLKDTRFNRADLGLIAKGLGGSRWLRVQMNRLTDNELRIIVQEMIDQADIASEPLDERRQSRQSVMTNVLKKVGETSQQITSNLK